MENHRGFLGVVMRVGVAADVADSKLVVAFAAVDGEMPVLAKQQSAVGAAGEIGELPVAWSVRVE